MPDQPGHPALIDVESFNAPYVLLNSVRDEHGRIVDFTYLAVNDAAVIEYALTRDELIGATLLDLDPLTGDGQLFERLAHVVETGEDLLLLDLQYAHAPPDGETLYFDVSARKVGDGLSVIWWNVTQRYEKDREVARAERETRAIVESLLDPLNVYEPVRDDRGRIIDMRCVRVNEAACAYLGVTREQSEGRRVLQTIGGEAGEVLVSWCRHVVLTGEPVVLDGVPLTLPNGKRRRYDVRAVPLGQAVSVTYRDVTRRVTAAQEIHEAKERYRLVAENASEMVFQSGPDGRIEWVSPSVQWVMGWPPEAVIGKRFSDFINPEDFAAAVTARRQLIASGAREGRVEVRMLNAEGEYRWMSVLGKAILDEAGAVLGGVDSVRDIQESRDAQAALVESEERFRRAMDDAAIGMAIVSPKGQYLRVNPAMSQILQRSEQELLDSTWQDLTHPDDLDKDQDLANQILTGERDTYRLAKRYVTPDGTVVWAELAVSCVRDDEGAVLHYLSQIIDITDSVTARKALAMSEEHYRLIAENSLDVVFRASPSGHMLWISPSVTEVLGWQPSEVLGQPILKFLHNGDLTPEATDTRSPHRIEFEGRVRQADGGFRWVDITSRPVLD
jgi:PAS domain S-box-containing protein